MTEVAVQIPSMLAGLVRGERRFSVEADDLEGALEAIFIRHPEFRVHVLDEQGRIRPHVMVFHNEDAVADLSSKVSPGDTLTILQAVSGGAAPPSF